MSQENVRLVRRWYEHFNEDRVDALLAMLHPDFICTTSGSFPDYEPVYHGRAGFARFYATQIEPWERLQIVVGTVLDREDHVIVEIHLHGKGNESGVEVNQNFHHAWRFREGVMDRLDSRQTLAEALEAAGLSE